MDLIACFRAQTQYLNSQSSRLNHSHNHNNNENKKKKKTKKKKSFSNDMCVICNCSTHPDYNGRLNVSIFEVLTAFYELRSYARSSIKRFNKNYDTFRTLCLSTISFGLH